MKRLKRLGKTQKCLLVQNILVTFAPTVKETYKKGQI